MTDELFEKWYESMELTGNLKYLFRECWYVASSINQKQDEEREDFLSAMESYPYD